MHQSAYQNEVQELQARVVVLEAELQRRQEAETSLRRTHYKLMRDVATNSVRHRTDSLDDQVTERHRSEQVLVRQTMTLSKTTAMLVEKERLLHAYPKIGQAILAFLDLDRILDTLTEEIVHASIFPNLAIALVDQEQERIEILRAFTHPASIGQVDTLVGPADLNDSGRVFALDSDTAIARVVRQGEMEFERVRQTTDNRAGHTDGVPADQHVVAFFIPVKRGERVLAVLETRAVLAEKAAVLKRIAAMQPLLDLVAVALEHARLYAEAQQQSQQLIRLERLQALGDLSLGVSHNLNNLLAKMLVPAQILQESSQDPHVLQEADEIVAAGQRAAELVRQLYRSVRVRQEGRLEPVQLNKIIAEAITTLQASIEAKEALERIEIRTALEEIPPVQGVAFEFSQVLVNLLDNAIDALSQGGHITIGTRPYKEGVQLYVRDNGCGMDEKTQQRAFEPFFTTKDDVGSGLGLSVVHNTIKLWNGTVETQSEPDQGTCCTLWLPAWDGPMEENTIPVEKATERAGRILLVQQDEVVRDILMESLGNLHQVEGVATGGEALERIVPGRYEVALVDAGMVQPVTPILGQIIRRPAF
jgi:signal transduction histidine kinase